jgi:hypothetical protein
MRDPIRAIVLTRAAGTVLFVVLLVFVLGASRQQGRIQRETELVGEVLDRTHELRQLTEAWPDHGLSEAGTWTYLVHQYLSAVPDGDVRLGFAAELAAIARNQAIPSLTLTDRTDPTMLGSGGVLDLHDQAVVVGSVGERLAGLDPGAVVAVDVEMEFRATYAQLLGVLQELAEVRRVVEMREFEVHRDAPTLEVSMVVRTYGRAS